MSDNAWQTCCVSALNTLFLPQLGTSSGIKLAKNLVFRNHPGLSYGSLSHFKQLRSVRVEQLEEASVVNNAVGSSSLSCAN